MSIIIKSTPLTYASLHDDVIYTVLEATKTADPTTYPNYKYVADVYVDSTLIARVKKVPDPTTHVGIFNVGQIVRNYIANEFNPVSNVLVAQQLGTGSFNLAVTIKFGEEYGFVMYTNLVVDSPRLLFNNYNGRLVGATSSLTAFANKVASNRPTFGDVLLTTSHYFISYFPTSTTPVAIIVTPTGGGTVYSTTIIPSHAYDLQVLNIAPAALNAVAAGTINAATTSYTVSIGGVIYTMRLICEPQYTVYAIHFLNKYGGYDTKLFNKVSKKTYDIVRKDFGKLPYTVDSDGQVAYKNSNNVYNENRPVYSSQFREKLLLNTDFLTDAEHAWLADLVLSTMVYIQDGIYFYPCVITDTNYEFKKFINDDLTNLVINIEYGQQLNAQFR